MAKLCLKCWAVTWTQSVPPATAPCTDPTQVRFRFKAGPMKSRIKVLVAIVAASTAIHSVDAQSREQRLAKLVEANVIAVHAFQVLLAKSSGKGQQCFAANTVSDTELNALSEHQAKLLKTDIKQLRRWVIGLEST